MPEEYAQLRDEFAKLAREATAEFAKSTDGLISAKGPIGAILGPAVKNYSVQCADIIYRELESRFHAAVKSQVRVVVLEVFDRFISGDQ